MLFSFTSQKSSSDAYFLILDCSNNLVVDFKSVNTGTSKLSSSRFILKFQGTSFYLALTSPAQISYFTLSTSNSLITVSNMIQSNTSSTESVLTSDLSISSPSYSQDIGTNTNYTPSCSNCGDAVPEGLEYCDDGNTYLLDGCDEFCNPSEVCGNGNLNTAAGE